MTTARLSMSSGSDSPRGRGAPILVVDDNPAKRLALRAILAPLGFTVVEAESGAAALRCIMADDFAAILIDVRMPIMDGFETATLIRLRAESELTPIIYLTAYAADELPGDRYTAGAVDFITSPVDPDELRAKVSALAGLFLQARANEARARELQVTADQLQRLTQTAPVGIFQIDAQGRYSYVNPRWTEITGIPGEDAVGAPWDVMLDTEQIAATAAEFESHQGEEFSSRLQIVTPEGSHRVVMLTEAAVLGHDGAPAGRVGTLADITAEAEAEAALVEARDHAAEASRLKSDFLHNMSHEIRTPMSGLLGWAELLLETDLDDDQRAYAQGFRRSGIALLKVINDILDFSSIDNGRVVLENVDFDLITVVNDVVATLSPTATSKGLSLVAVLEESVPAVVKGDPMRVHQVLSHLTANAIKFTETGEIAIRVTADRVAQPDAIVRFEVCDTGIGITPEKLGMIFEPFTQSDISFTREYGGTGLGLALAGRLAQLMGGQVGVTSNPGPGSTFWFTIGEQHRTQRLSSVSATPEDEVDPTLEDDATGS